MGHYDKPTPKADDQSDKEQSQSSAQDHVREEEKREDPPMITDYASI